MFNRQAADTIRRSRPATARRRHPATERVVLVRPDGSSLLLLRARHRSLHLGLLAALAAATAVGLLAADWVELRRASVDSEAFAQRLAYEEQQNTRLRASLAGVRRELEVWPKLEAAIAAPFDRVPKDRSGSEAVDDAEEMLGRVRQGTAALQDAAALMTRLKTVVAPLPSHWPVRSAVNSHFGPRRSPHTGEPEFHKGIDLAARTGSPVHAPAPGNVARAAGPRGSRSRNPSTRSCSHCRPMTSSGSAPRRRPSLAARVYGAPQGGGRNSPVPPSSATPAVRGASSA